MSYIGNKSGGYDLVRDSYTGNGSQTTFALTYFAPNSNSVIVFVNGVIQTSPTNYSVGPTGSSLVFTSAPANSASILVIYLGNPLDIGVPADTSVITSKIANLAVTNAKVASNAVSFDKFDTNLQNTNSIGYKNKLINGSFNINQRGSSSYTLSGSYVYTFDRWYCAQGGSSGFASIANSSSGSVLDNGSYTYITRPNGSTNTNTIGILQVIESVNCKYLAGKQVTMSLYACCDPSISGRQLRFYVSCGSGTDQGAASCVALTWTSQTTPLDTTVSLTNTWTRYTVTGTIPSGTNEVAVLLSEIPTGTAGSTDNVYIANVQLEEGSTATTYERRAYSQELALCQRYYEFGNNVQIGGGTNDYMIETYSFKVSKRVTPTMGYNTAGGVNVSGNIVDSPDMNGFRIIATGTANQAWWAINWTASAEL